MNKFIFDIQRFADGQVTLAAGETYTLDGVTYTATSIGATLNLRRLDFPALQH